MRITKVKLQALIQEELTYILAEASEDDELSEASWESGSDDYAQFGDDDDDYDEDQQDVFSIDKQDQEDASRFVDNILPEWASEFEVEPHSDLTQVMREKLEALYLDILEQAW